MSKKAPNMDDLVADAQKTQSAKVTPIDSKIKRTITVTIDEVIACPFNPRTQRNPRYDQIKESIRQRGLDHAPNITREKPTDPYMIRDGGNTRLEILKELWEETKDERFYRFESTFHPWSSASELLVGHLVENDLRGDTLFIERAVAAVNLKAMLEEQGQQSLSIRETAERFTALGWVIDHSNLAVLFYAHEKLFPFTPQAFWAGMGRPKIKQLRRLYSAYTKYCGALQFPEEELIQCWQDSLTSNDDEDLNIDAVILDTNNALAHQLDTYGHLINGEIETILRGAEPTGRLSTKTETEAQFSATASAGAKTELGSGTAPSLEETTNTTLAQASDNSQVPGATVEPTRLAVGDVPDIYRHVMQQRKKIFDLSQQLLDEVGLNPDIAEFTPSRYYGYQINIEAMIDTFVKNSTTNNIGRSSFMITLYGLCGWQHFFLEPTNAYTQAFEEGEESDSMLLLESHIWRVVFSLRTNPWPEAQAMNLTVRVLEQLITELRVFALDVFGHDQYLGIEDLWKSQETFDAKLGAIKEQKQQNK